MFKDLTDTGPKSRTTNNRKVTEMELAIRNRKVASVVGHIATMDDEE